MVRKNEELIALKEELLSFGLTVSLALAKNNLIPKYIKNKLPIKCIQN